MTVNELVERLLVFDAGHDIADYEFVRDDRIRLTEVEVDHERKEIIFS